MKKTIISAFVLFFTIQFSVAQKIISSDDTTTTNYYRIDATLKLEIEQEIIKWEDKNPSKKMEGGLLEAEHFVDDKETFSTFGKEKIEYFFPFSISQ